MILISFFTTYNAKEVEFTMNEHLCKSYSPYDTKIFYYRSSLWGAFKMMKEWRFFYFNSILGCRVIQVLIYAN